MPRISATIDATSSLNFTFDLGGDAVEHPFEFKSLVDKCGGDNKFWDFKVFRQA